MLRARLRFAALVFVAVAEGERGTPAASRAGISTVEIRRGVGESESVSGRDGGGEGKAVTEAT